ncbi:hypothetical protein LSCM4_02862 [Leishmania orientalis]|uniref:Uncharacterized protein n=1 Tax=Leishmania orientalis TaxID=2249476 RepID=A0A836KLJ7_9TRYP|nr:hypothetical protein LSCM4_02862 [Leishmania orientalis]
MEMNSLRVVAALRFASVLYILEHLAVHGLGMRHRHSFTSLASLCASQHFGFACGATRMSDGAACECYAYAQVSGAYGRSVASFRAVRTACVPPLRCVRDLYVNGDLTASFPITS